MLVLSRVTKYFHLKTDIVAMIKSVESQVLLTICRDAKNFLITSVGYAFSLILCGVTDGAVNCVNARKPGNLSKVGFYVHLDGTCIDHKFKLGCNDALNLIYTGL